MIKEHDCVVLTANVPNEGLVAGDIGTIVHIHKGGEGYEVEFMTLTGETVAIITLLAGQVRPLNRRDLAHTRELAPA
jgi:ATP-dependent exoDNAse (exonuclease V) alpha subunit